jgi:hypothetical protein
LPVTPPGFSGVEQARLDQVEFFFQDLESRVKKKGYI